MLLRYEVFALIVEVKPVLDLLSMFQNGIVDLQKADIFDGEHDFDDYLARMSRNGTYGDGLVLSAAVHLYQCPIIVIQQNGIEIKVDGPNLPPSAIPIKLGYMSLMATIGGGDEKKELNHYVGLLGTCHAVSQAMLCLCLVVQNIILSGN